MIIPVSNPYRVQMLVLITARWRGYTKSVAGAFCPAMGAENNDVKQITVLAITQRQCCPVQLISIDRTANRTDAGISAGAKPSFRLCGDFDCPTGIRQ